MRILFVTNHYPPHAVGGYELLCAATAHALGDRGHRVCVLTSEANAPDPPWVNRVLRFDPSAEEGHGTGHNEAVVRSFAQAADVALVWNTYGLGHAAVFRGLGDLPSTCYLMLHDLAYYGPPRLRDLELIAASQCIRFHFLRRGFSPHAVRVIYPGVLLPREVRCHQPGPVRLLYCGRLVSYKGLHVVLHALPLLPQDFTLTVVGAADPQGSYAAAMVEWVRREGWEDRVVFAGRLPPHEALQQYAQHDVLVFPSLWEEPLGLVLLEAMAYGLAITCARRGAAGELLTHGRTALFHEPGDHQDLASCLLALADPSVRATLGHAARQTAQDRFAFPRYVDELERALTELAARG